MSVKDGPSCPACGLPNYEGVCPVCRGDADAARREGLPYLLVGEQDAQWDDFYREWMGVER